jgi:hypothetical protein
VKFGISPFGVWRPGYPPITEGKFDSYAELYGDSRKWVLNGWADYFTPQLYWPITRADLSYPVLLQWWVEQNAKGRHIWPGNYLDKVNPSSPSGWPAEELLDQIAATRAQRGATGNVYFSMRSFMFGQDGLPEKLVAGPYASVALVPASPWLDSVPPPAPLVLTGRDATGSVTITVQPQGTEPVWLWSIRTRTGSEWTNRIFPGFQRSFAIPRAASGVALDELAVSAIDRTGNESAPVLIAIVATGQ